MIIILQTFESQLLQLWHQVRSTFKSQLIKFSFIQLWWKLMHAYRGVVSKFTLDLYACRE